MMKSGKIYYYHLNTHGDVVSLTDENGSTVSEYQYDAWGNIISQSGLMATENPYRYAGYQFDEELGLYYLMARYYNPNNGRFLTRDTFLGFESEPFSLNRYIYTQNNPVNKFDPTGHCAWWTQALSIVSASVTVAGMIVGSPWLVGAGVVLGMWSFGYSLYKVMKKHTNYRTWSFWKEVLTTAASYSCTFIPASKIGELIRGAITFVDINSNVWSCYSRRF